MRVKSAETTLIAAQTNTCGENERNASSIANTRPVIGALNATARPELEPAAICNLLVIRLRFKVTPTASPAQPPICNDGPSAPAERPRKIHASDAANIEHIVTYHLKRIIPRAAPSICGMPLPRIIGTNLTTVPMTIPPAASPSKSNGTNAGFSRTSEYSFTEVCSPTEARML